MDRGELIFDYEQPYDVLEATRVALISPILFFDMTACSWRTRLISRLSFQMNRQYRQIVCCGSIAKSLGLLDSVMRPDCVQCSQ